MSSPFVGGNVLVNVSQLDLVHFADELVVFQRSRDRREMRESVVSGHGGRSR